MLIVTHIPKTAGTTLRVFLWRHIKEERRFAVHGDIVGDMAFLLHDPTEVARLEVLFGHICYGWHEALDIRKPEYVTILRDPVIRAGSLFDFASKYEGHYLYSRTRYMSFQKFMSSGVTRTADNAMVRQLCGVDRFLREPERDMVIPFGEVTKDHLEMAKENLRSYFLVGISERYQNFQNALSTKMGWPLYLQEFWNPRHVGRRTNIEKDRRWAEDFLSLDCKLYEFAKGLAP